MPDRILPFLNVLITAVDEGFSPDGILSVPEIGLEDAAYRPGLAGLSDRVVDAFHAVTAAISRVFRKSQPPTPSADTPNARDSGIGTNDARDKTLLSVDEKLDQGLVTLERMPRRDKQALQDPPTDPALPGHGGGEPVQDPLGPGALGRSPRKSKQDLRSPGADQDSPAPEDAGPSQASPRPGNAPERLPRKRKQDHRGGDVSHGKGGDQN